MTALDRSARFPFPVPSGWFAVAFSDELARGAVRGLRYFAQELVLFRGEDGAAHVLDAYCPHRLRPAAGAISIARVM